MLLYAGITSFSFKYSSLANNLVTKLKQRSQSAGNFAPSNTTNLTTQKVNNYLEEGLYYINNNSKSSSETLRNKTNTFIKQVSIHVPTHLKPKNDNDFGYYLAGIIDAAGNFSIKNSDLQLVIKFNELDASLAYFLKQRLGFGRVFKIKNEKAIIFVVSKLQGIAKVINLINGKIRSQNKLNQIRNNVLSNPYFSSGFFQPNTTLDLNQVVNNHNTVKIFNLNENSDLQNYWLCGFSDIISKFNIQILNSSTCSIDSVPEIRLTFQLDYKEIELLTLIKSYLGGNINYNKNQDYYCYNTITFESAKKIIDYFNQYHLLSLNHVNYLKWRKTYVIIQNNEHLTVSGFNKIIKNQKSMNKN
uniref:LAGLIDADG endonuclease n=1 Tax=Inonotus hispidus TaxID=40469 RepID=UPI00218254C9|nr:LAGLIDADG endonuclease [Inonotus hispidus]YP_010691044.1 LAGLIDADG endonuclease [Phellinus igniarius]UVF37956.1 LAGLIDADG endonuclease [Inonotus hispidus]WBU93145.1 LAGLIDADG endonuclease [Phellinus igniarius]